MSDVVERVARALRIKNHELIDSTFLVKHSKELAKTGQKTAAGLIKA